MKYSKLYVKRSFTQNLKKQVFLILGITFLMTAVTDSLLWSDSNISEVKDTSKKMVESQKLSNKYCELSKEQADFLAQHEDIEYYAAIAYLNVEAGIENIKKVIQPLPEELWEPVYLYGDAPKPGEVLLSSEARISGRRPVVGEEIQFLVFVGEEEQTVTATVSGVYDYRKARVIENYAILAEEDYHALLERFVENESFLKYDAFFSVKDFVAAREKNIAIGVGEYDRKVQNDFCEKYTAVPYSVSNGGSGTLRDDSEVWNISLMFINGFTSIILCTISMCALIYIVLQDEKKNVGILRALGATKRQIAAMFTARILAVGTIATVLGTVFGMALFKIKETVLYDSMEANFSARSIVMIPAMGCVLLLFLQLPGVCGVLRKTPLELFIGASKVGENLLESTKRRFLGKRRPLLWYSSLELWRLRGRSIAFCLIMVSNFSLLVGELFHLNNHLLYAAQQGVPVTCTVYCEEGSFSKAQIEEILSVDGIKEYGYDTVLDGEYLYWGEKTIDVKLALVDETSYRELWDASVKSQKLTDLPEDSEVALAGDTLLLVPVLNSNSRDYEELKEGASVELLCEDGEMLPCTVGYFGKKEKSAGYDFRVYLSYDTYSKAYASSLPTQLLITLEGTEYEEAKKAIESLAPIYRVEQNEVMVDLTKEQMKSDYMVNSLAMILPLFCVALAFLFCYFSFYYLSKEEEYRMLYALGASKRMIRKVIVFHAVQISVLSTVATVVVAYGYALLRIRKMKEMVPVGMEGLSYWMIPVLFLIVLVTSVGTTLLSSRSVVKNLKCLQQ